MAARAVLDEFTAPAAKAALLERGRGRIEGLFGVSLAVLGALGAEEPPPARIWVQLRGAQEAVHSAKVSARRPAAGPRPGASVSPGWAGADAGARWGLSRGPSSRPWGAAAPSLPQACAAGALKLWGISLPLERLAEP